MSDSECPPIVDLVEFVQAPVDDGTLSGERIQEIAAHVAGCDVCRFAVDTAKGPAQSINPDSWVAKVVTFE